MRSCSSIIRALPGSSGGKLPGVTDTLRRGERSVHRGGVEVAVRREDRYRDGPGAGVLLVF